jgi:ubiquinone/menaquinone biosynthesis C-methylase UbiE
MWEDTFDRAAPDYDAPELWFLDDAAAVLAEAVGIETGERVLDVATGTGKLAASATAGVGDGGLVVGLDISGGMLRQARGNVASTRASFVQGDATALPLRDRSFDLALMGFGISFLPAPVAAFRDVRRVLRGGGRLGLSTTAHDCFAPLLDVFLDALERGGMPRPRPSREAWRSVDRPEHLEHVLGRAGFAERRVRRLELGTFLEDPLEFWALLRGSAWRGTIDRLSSADQARVREELVTGAERLREARGIPLRTPVLIATATRGRVPLRTLVGPITGRVRKVLG